MAPTGPTLRRPWRILARIVGLRWSSNGTTCICAPAYVRPVRRNSPSWRELRSPPAWELPPPGGRPGPTTRARRLHRFPEDRNARSAGLRSRSGEDTAGRSRRPATSVRPRPSTSPSRSTRAPSATAVRDSSKRGPGADPAGSAELPFASPPVTMASWSESASRAETASLFLPGRTAVKVEGSAGPAATAGAGSEEDRSDGVPDPLTIGTVRESGVVPATNKGSRRRGPFLSPAGERPEVGSGRGSTAWPFITVA